MGGAFQLLEYQWSEGKFDINKPAATRPDASDNSMTEATSMGAPSIPIKDAAQRKMGKQNSVGKRSVFATTALHNMSKLNAIFSVSVG